jgi:predicted DNA-binding WGR domain protein
MQTCSLLLNLSFFWTCKEKLKNFDKPMIGSMADEETIQRLTSPKRKKGLEEERKFASQVPFSPLSVLLFRNCR